MRKFITIFIIVSASAFMAIGSHSQDQATIIEKIPDIKDVYRVSAEYSHSGLPVPRFVSLKYNRVNGRQGPSLKHSVLWQYRRKGLPLVVVAEMDIWRKVRDIHGDESWVRGNSLSGKRMVMAQEETTLHSRPNENALITAIADPKAILELNECNMEGWCKVRSTQGYRGWAKERTLWGVAPI